MSAALVALGIWLLSSILFGLLAGRFFQAFRNVRQSRAKRYSGGLKVWYVKSRIPL